MVSEWSSHSRDNYNPFWSRGSADTHLHTPPPITTAPCLFTLLIVGHTVFTNRYTLVSTAAARQCVMRASPNQTAGMLLVLLCLVRDPVPQAGDNALQTGDSAI